MECEVSLESLEQQLYETRTVLMILSEISLPVPVKFRRLWKISKFQPKTLEKSIFRLQLNSVYCFYMFCHCSEQKSSTMGVKKFYFKFGKKNFHIKWYKF